MTELTYLADLITTLNDRDEHNKRMTEREAMTKRERAAAFLLKVRKENNLDDILGVADPLEWQEDVVSIISHGELNGIPFKFDAWVGSSFASNFQVDIHRLDNGHMDGCAWRQNDDGELINVAGEAAGVTELSIRVVIAEAVRRLL